MRLIHNYWGVMLSLVISGFPFTFLLTLSYVTGIDPALEQAGAMLGARSRQRFFRILLPLLAPGLAITLALAFVQAFTVFPSAILLGAPAGPTRVISIVAYQAAFEQFDYPLASAIAMLMAADPGGDHCRRCWARGCWCSAARSARARAERDASQSRRAAVVLHVSGRWWRSSSLNLLAMIGSVVVDSFGTRWFNTWLPAGFTPQWYVMAWDEFQLPDILIVTAEVVGTVVLMSGLIGVPTAYAMARRNFPGKQVVMLLFLLPLLVPPITYGIPMATVLYQAHLAGTIWGVILANLVPTVPFVILIMIPVRGADRSAGGSGGAGVRRRHGAAVRAGAGAAADAGHPGGAAAGAGAHHRDVRADVPDLGADQPDAGGGAVLRGVRRGGAVAAVDRRDGGGLHDHHADLAADRAAVREPDADRDAGEAVGRRKGSHGDHGGPRSCPCCATHGSIPDIGVPKRIDAMRITVTPEQEALIRHAIENGGLDRPADAATEALLLWEEPGVAALGPDREPRGGQRVNRTW